MRFANLSWNDRTIKGSKYMMINVGDKLQFMAIDNLYNCMNISKEEIIYLSVDETTMYDGEEMLLLPLNRVLFDPSWMKEGKFCISEKVWPVFLGMTLGCAYQEEFFNEYNIQYLKHYEPIGCRDLETYQKMCQYGIKAYLNGCLSILFAKRDKEPENGKVFFDDAPIELNKYVPSEWIDEGVYITQQYYFKENTSADELEEVVRRHYQRIKNEAKLVITSRLHMASPCVAMGIPVIFAKKVIDSRFGWLEKYLPFYDYNNFSQIDWYPQAIDFEKEKSELIRMNINRVLIEKYKLEMEGIMNDYYNISKKQYINFAKYIRGNWDGVTKFMEKSWDKNRKIEYAVWGLIASSDEFVDYVEREYPNAKLVKVIDAYKEGTFRGVLIEKPETIEKSDYYLLVLSVGASNEAYKVCREKGFSEERYYLVGDVYMRAEV